MHITDLFIPLWVFPLIGTVICAIVGAIIAKGKEYRGAYGGYVPDLGPVVVWVIVLIIVLMIWLIYFALT